MGEKEKIYYKIVYYTLCYFHSHFDLTNLYFCNCSKIWPIRAKLHKNILQCTKIILYVQKWWIIEDSNFFMILLLWIRSLSGCWHYLRRFPGEQSTAHACAAFTASKLVITLFCVIFHGLALSATVTYINK